MPVLSPLTVLSQVVTADVLRDARILILHMVRADLQPSTGPVIAAAPSR